MQVIKYDEVANKIIEIREQNVILDSDVAELYDVETKHINQAVSRNLDKFPEDFVIYLNVQEKNELVTNCDRFAVLKHSTAKPKAFTEQGLYMLATILKSPKAVETTIAIIRTFAQVKNLTQSVYQFAAAKTNDQRVKIFENSTEIVAQLLGNEMTVSQEETGFKIKLPFFELTRKVTKMKK